MIFLLDDSAAKVALYAGLSQTLNGKAMFVTADEASPLASFIVIDDPVKDAARIAAAVKAGFIVRTRADDETVEARAGDTRRRDQAFASGAQIIQTDFLLSDKKIGAYQVSISDPGHVRCDSATGLVSRTLRQLDRTGDTTGDAHGRVAVSFTSASALGVAAPSAVLSKMHQSLRRNRAARSSASRAGAHNPNNRFWANRASANNEIHPSRPAWPRRRRVRDRPRPLRNLKFA